MWQVDWTQKDNGITGVWVNLFESFGDALEFYQCLAGDGVRMLGLPHLVL